MEAFQDARERSLRSLKTAEHMAYITYPLVRDGRMLLAICENIFLSFSKAMAALLDYDHYKGRIPAVGVTFEAKLHAFVKYYGGRIPLEEYVAVMRELKELVLEHRKSPVEFVRKDSFVICSDEYEMKTLTFDKVKRYIGTAKDFFKIVDGFLVRRDYAREIG